MINATNSTNNSINNLIYQGRLHKILFVGPCALFVIMLILAYEIPALSQISYFLALLVLLWGGVVALRYAFSFLLIKKKHVILCTGIIVRQTIDISLEKIESIDIRQSILGSIFNYGTLIITGTGGTRQYVEYLNQPLTCRRYIEQLLHD